MLIDEYGDLVVGIVRKYLGSLKTYEDECVDDVLMSIWNNISSFDEGKGSFKNWVGVIAKYKAINYKRKYINELNYKSIEEDDVLLKEKDFLLIELQDEIDCLLSSLDEQDKKIFIRYYLEDFSLEEIAYETNLTKANIYSRMSRGRKRLRKLYLKNKEV